ncbi:hypothetical protein Nepgr_006600 [Nepenthes gracilis]|uniref:Uncharacterized protein n=1 Tax=Nepenthes gracilis TaxID=150966 RepID=A0AAD3S5R9_NEPGR|nr:hypothetical protein Nepgr_006600 [Nepenthes gracilis]
MDSKEQPQQMQSSVGIKSSFLQQQQAIVYPQHPSAESSIHQRQHTPKTQVASRPHQLPQERGTISNISK